MADTAHNVAELVKTNADNSNTTKKATPIYKEYESIDVLILRDALLASKGFLLNHKTNLVEPIDISKVSIDHRVYILSTVHGREYRGVLEGICLALLNNASEKQILFPFRFEVQKHWVTCRININIKSNIIRIGFQVYDSLGHDNKELYDSFKEDIIPFFNDSKKLSEFISNPERVAIFKDDKVQQELVQVCFEQNKSKIQFSIPDSNIKLTSIQINNSDMHVTNLYCGGYTARLMVSLALNARQDLSKEDVWGCNGKKSTQLILEDVEVVNKHATKRCHLFGVKGDGHYLGTVAHAKTEYEEQKVMAHLTQLLNLELQELNDKSINELWRLISINDIDGTKPEQIKALILQKICRQPGEIPTKIFFPFFTDGTKQLDDSVRLNTKVAIPNLWNSFLNLIKARLKTQPPSPPSTTKNSIVKSEQKPQIWNQNLVNHFLNVTLIPPAKVYRVDCFFEETTHENIRNWILSIKKELLNKTRGSTALLARKLDNKLIFFLMSFEESKSKLNKRCSLSIYCSTFLQDYKHDLTSVKNWAVRINLIKFSSNSSSFIQQLYRILFTNLANDFPAIEGFAQTRLNTYKIPEAEVYQEAISLHKLLCNLEIDIQDSLYAKEKIELEKLKKLQEKYFSQAQYAFLSKNPNVAKSQQGFAYEEHLIMLIAYLAMKSQGQEAFSLLAEAQVPEAWNDVVLEWKENLIFFQQKHRSLYTTGGSPIYTPSHFIASTEDPKNSEDSSILKYYRAYLELINKINDNNHPLHTHASRISKHNIKFVFFTNKTFSIT